MVKDVKIQWIDDWIVCYSVTESTSGYLINFRGQKFLKEGKNKITQIN